MTDWRNELIKDVTNAMYKVENMPYLKLLVMARAALAVAEPVIREHYADLADRMGVIADGHNVAAAIREGGQDE